ncbi:unnamed protein product [Gadus morhua 'NCC']
MPNEQLDPAFPWPFCLVSAVAPPTRRDNRAPLCKLPPELFQLISAQKVGAEWSRPFAHAAVCTGRDASALTPRLCDARML